MSIYWVFFKLPKNVGEMRLSVDAETNELATSLATKKAHSMSKEWIHTRTVCVR